MGNLCGTLGEQGRVYISEKVGIGRVHDDIIDSEHLRVQRHLALRFSDRVLDCSNGEILLRITK